MSKVHDRSTTIELLLNALEAERYVRRALLENVIAELGAIPEAAAEGRALLSRLDRGATELEFKSGLASLRRSVAKTRAAAPDSAPVIAA